MDPAWLPTQLHTRYRALQGRPWLLPKLIDLWTPDLHHAHGPAIRHLPETTLINFPDGIVNHPTVIPTLVYDSYMVASQYWDYHHRRKTWVHAQQLLLGLLVWLPVDSLPYDITTCHGGSIGSKHGYPYSFR